jgi:hypothetical protein
MQFDASSASVASELDREIIKNMLNAMQNALAIYFYRRIHDVDSSLLQQKVAGVLEDKPLRRAELTNQSENDT